MRVLVVDDDATVRLLLKALLKKHSEVLDIFSDGKSAIEAYKKNYYDVLFIDWILPDIDGLDIIRSIREQPEGQWPFLILITARNEPKELHRILTTGADDYMPKPISPELFLVRMQIVISQVQYRKKSRQAEERLTQLSLQDYLTGIPHRNYFVQALNDEFVKLKADAQHSFAVLFIDINQFKKVNDSLGHVLGDEILKEVANRIKSYIQLETGPDKLLDTEKDFVARFASDEFMVLIGSKVDESFLKSLAVAISIRIAEPYIRNGIEIYLSCCIGITKGNPQHHKATQMINDADLAMHKAKEQGLIFAIFDDSLRVRSHKKWELERALLKALELKQFRLFYQPVVSTELGRVVGVEALIRWSYQGKFVSPDEFIPQAEKSGIIVNIGYWVLQEAFEYQVKLTAQGYNDAFVAINLSPRQFDNDDFFTKVKELLKKTGADPRKIHLEVTERITVDINKTKQLIDQFRQLGFSISIDDFGTGYSSLRYLQSLMIDVLKIDRSFTMNLTVSEFSVGITRMIVEMANMMKAEVVAEGVETEAELKKLQVLGVKLFQGYLFSKPLPESESIAAFENLFSKKS